MLPVLKGLIARRVLPNFRADAHIVQSMLPRPFVVDTCQGAAIVGVCLIRLEQLRPKGLPSQVGIASENVAHRVAVRYPINGEMRPGVFIWRRETNQMLVQRFGGRLFPGVHHGATFLTQEDEHGIRMDVKSDDGESDVSFSASYGQDWTPTAAFKTLQEASGFFQQGGHGFSHTRSGDTVEGMELRTLQWFLRPLTVELKRVAFYGNSSRFPAGSVEFDCGLIMRSVPHEWHEIRELPELGEVPSLEQCP
jgi:uncharacterized protein YqjF (DUF2071 family)